MTTTPPIFRSLVESEVVRAVHRAAQGTEVHLVGGALRDCYLGVPGPDLDFVAAGCGRRLASRLADLLQARLVPLGGDRFAAYRLVRSDLTLDIWDRQGASLLSDLERRDFTVNAIALDLYDGRIHDPFQGLSDLKALRLRAVTDSSLLSDPQRTLRLVRFALLLPGFSVEPRTADLARAAAPSISEVAPERIREELATVLSRGKPTRAVELLVEIDLFPRLWGRRECTRRTIERLTRLVAAYDDAEAMSSEVFAPGPDRLVCVHALIARALAKEPGPATSQLISLLTRSQGRTVNRLSQIDPLEMSRSPRQFLARWGDSWREAGVLSGALQDDPDLGIGTLLGPIHDLVEAEGHSVLHPQPLLDGQEIQDLLGLAPGPEIGRLLEDLLGAQLDGEITDRRAAVEFVRKARTIGAPAEGF